MKDQQGLLFVLSGPSGAGKSTVLKEVLRRNPALYFSVSCTTRMPRPAEIHGIHYFFIGREQFEEMIQRNEFLEYTEYAKDYYGTPLLKIQECMASGTDVLLDIETEGAQNVIQKMPEAVRIFLVPPSFEELERRLRSRGTDTEDKILARLQTAREEWKKMPSYDYLVVNDVVENAVQELESILKAEHCRTARRIEQMKEAL
ncbi:MAG: guanylate kinase [Oscillospiraceae bacterium]|nr:guanylate kinase [Oscillospiraceae bacterium]